jgi:hypothetical protein
VHSRKTRIKLGRWFICLAILSNLHKIQIQLLFFKGLSAISKPPDNDVKSNAIKLYNCIINILDWLQKKRYVSTLYYGPSKIFWSQWTVPVYLHILSGSDHVARQISFKADSTYT